MSRPQLLPATLRTLHVVATNLRPALHLRALHHRPGAAREQLAIAGAPGLGRAGRVSLPSRAAVTAAVNIEL